MQSLFARKRGIFLIIGTLGFIATLLIYYYLVYIPKNEKYVLEQNFRILRTIGSVLTEKIKAYNELANDYSKIEKSKNIDSVIAFMDNRKIFNECRKSKNVVNATGDNPENSLIIDSNKVIFKGTVNHKFTGTFPLNQFLDPVLTNQAFEGFFLVSDNKIIYDGTHLGLSREEFIQKSSLGNNLFQSCQVRLEINGVWYRVFATPLQLFHRKSQIVIGGFVEDNKIQSQISMVNPYFLISLFFILTLSMLLLPFFKVWVLGKRDSLDLSDVAAVYITGFMLVAVFSLWLLYGGKNFHGQSQEEKIKADSILHQVARGFKIDFDSSSGFLKKIQKDEKRLEISKPNEDSNIKKAFWLSKKGIMDTIGSFDSNHKFKPNYFNIKTNLSQRNYFKVVANDSTAVAIEPVISKSDGHHEFVFATRFKPKNPISDSVSLIGISMVPRPLNNSILPAGIDMALIDRTGKVILHSDSGKNMKENFLDELDDGEILKGALKQGNADIFEARYFDKLCEIHVHPLNGYPDFFVVRIRNTELWQSNKIKALMATTSCLIFILFLVFLITYFVYAIKTKNSLRKNGGQYLSWTYPKPKFRNLYKTTSLFGFGLISIFIVAFIYTKCHPCYFNAFVFWWVLFCPVFFVVPLIGKTALTFLEKYIPNSDYPKDEKRPSFFPSSRSYVRWYSFLIFIKLCFFSLLPTWFLFLGSHQYFSEKFNQYSLYDFASRWSERDGNLISTKFGKTVFGGRIQIQKYPCNITKFEQPTTNFIFDLLEENLTSGYGYSFKSIKNKYEGNIKIRLDEDSRETGSVLFWEKDEYNLSLKTIFNPEPLPRFENNFAGIWFYVLFVMGLSLIFLLIFNIIKKIFGISVPDHKVDKSVTESRLKYLLSKDCKSNFIFVQGLTSSCKTDLIKRILIEESKIPASEIGQIDLLNIPDGKEYQNPVAIEKWEKECHRFTDKNEFKVIIVIHFEYNIEDEHTNQIMLNLMEKLTQKSDCKLIITSSIDPTGFLESLNDSKSMNQNQEKVFSKTARWNVLLGKFVNVLVPINTPFKLKRSNSLEYELSSSEFLNSIKEIYSERADYTSINAKYQGDENDEVMIDLHQTTIHHYRAIWNSINPEEKIILFDLAEEGLLNTSNYLSLYGLISKGLIIKVEGVFYLLNESFRHFILTSVTKAEMNKAESSIDENSLWKDTQGPILVVIAALIWFVLYANQEQFGTIFPLLTAFATGLPTILKVFSYFSPGAAK